MKLASWVALGAVACATPAASPVPCPPTAQEAAAEAVEPCLERRPPPPPKIGWLPKGCPANFAGCLSPEDAAALSKYLLDVRHWADHAWKDCGDGR